MSPVPLTSRSLPRFLFTGKFLEVLTQLPNFARLYWRLFNSLKPAAGTFANLDAHYVQMMARSAVQKTIRIESAIGYELPA